ncbi:hypothetical protein Bbelb_174470 [Branchiostoma belcheri]|nr:hypothetical protein Bbelb_174470 [Branchiostoma belcheri]
MSHQVGKADKRHACGMCRRASVPVTPRLTLRKSSSAKMRTFLRQLLQSVAHRGSPCQFAADNDPTCSGKISTRITCHHPRVPLPWRSPLTGVRGGAVGRAADVVEFCSVVEWVLKTTCDHFDVMLRRRAKTPRRHDLSLSVKEHTKFGKLSKSSDYSTMSAQFCPGASANGKSTLLLVSAAPATTAGELDRLELEGRSATGITNDSSADIGKVAERRATLPGELVSSHDWRGDGAVPPLFIQSAFAVYDHKTVDLTAEGPAVGGHLCVIIKMAAGRRQGRTTWPKCQKHLWGCLSVAHMMDRWYTMWTGQELKRWFLPENNCWIGEDMLERRV